MPDNHPSRPSEPVPDGRKRRPAVVPSQPAAKRARLNLPTLPTSDSIPDKMHLFISGELTEDTRNKTPIN